MQGEEAAGVGGRGEEEKFIMYCKRGAPGSQRPVVHVQYPPRLTQPNNMFLESQTDGPII